MKTTIDLPDDLLRRAKIEAATRGVPLRQIVTEALEHRLEQGAPGEPAWRRSFGGLADLRKETRAVDARIAAEFEDVDDEDA